MQDDVKLADGDELELPPKAMNRFRVEPMFQFDARYSPGSGAESKYVSFPQS